MPTWAVLLFMACSIPGAFGQNDPFDWLKTEPLSLGEVSRLETDASGRVYAVGAGRLRIFSPAGDLLGETPADDVAIFGDTLYSALFRGLSIIISEYDLGSVTPRSEYVVPTPPHTIRRLLAGPNGPIVPGWDYPDDRRRYAKLTQLAEGAPARSFVLDQWTTQDIVDLAVGPAGDVYLLGNSGDEGIVPSPDAFQTALDKTLRRTYLAKIAPALDRIAFATYVQGLITSFATHTLASQTDGDICLAAEFFAPALGGLFPAEFFDRSTNEYSIVVACLEASGKALTFSRAFGGHQRPIISADANDNLWVASKSSQSISWLGLSADGATILSSGLAGGPMDQATTIAAASDGSMFLAGKYESPVFPAFDNETYDRWFPGRSFMGRVAPNPTPADVEIRVLDMNPPAPTGGFTGGIFSVLKLGVTNLGPGVARNVHTSTPLPFWSCTAAEGSECGGRILTPTLEAGQTAIHTLRFRGELTSARTIGGLPMRVGSSSYDPNLSNNLGVIPVESNTTPIRGWISSSPPGMEVWLSDRDEILTGIEFPLSFAAGARLEVEFPSPQTYDGITYTFRQWDDGVEENPRTFVLPSRDFSRQAVFEPDRRVMRPRPARVHWAGVAGALSAGANSIRMPIEIEASGTRGIPFRVRPLSEPWIEVATPRGVVPNKISLVVYPDRLPGPGLYATELVVDVELDQQPEIRTPIDLELLSDHPLLSAEGIVNAASYRPGVAPGMITTIFGANLGPRKPVSIAPEQGVRFPTLAGGARVSLDGQAGLLSVAPTQVSFVASFDLSRSPNLCYELGNSRECPAPPPYLAFNPGLFTLDATGRGQAAALNSDGSVNGFRNPVRPDDVILVFGTGFGKLEPRAEGPEVAGSALRRHVATVEATLGGVPAEVLYAGTSPGSTVGLTQINIRIPQNAPTGDAVEVVTSANGVTSQPGVTISIER